MIKSKVVARLADAQSRKDAEGIRRWSTFLETIEARELELQAELRIQRLAIANRELNIQMLEMSAKVASLSFDIDASQI